MDSVVKQENNTSPTTVEEKRKDFGQENNTSPTTVEEKRNDFEQERTNDELCGIGKCRPHRLQGCARLIVFTLFLSFSGLCSHTLGAYSASQVTSIERHYELNSAQMGALFSANDIGFLLTVLFVSHFAKHAYIPRILAFAFIVFGLSSALVSTMYFVSPRSLQDSNSGRGGPNNSVTANVTGHRKYLCVPKMADRTLDEDCSRKTGDGSSNHLPVVVGIGMLLAIQGVGKAARQPLGNTYIDNNIQHKSNIGVHFGLMNTVMLFGPPIGFAMGGFFSRIPVDLQETTMSSLDPRWIGAWWLGFLVAGLLTAVSSLPLFFFPRRMPAVSRIKMESEGVKSDKDYKDRGEDWSNTGNGDAEALRSDINTVQVSDVEDKSDASKDETRSNSNKEKFKKSLKDLSLSLLRILKNRVYFVILMAFSIFLFSVIGFSTFLIKFAEKQFGLPSWLSASVFGLSNIVLGGIGTFTGGLLVTKMNLTRRGCLRLVVTASTISTVLAGVNVFVGCEGQKIVGLQVRDHVLDDGVVTCRCDRSQYLPVCDGRQTFLSPCHAGCTRIVNVSTFLDCGAAVNGSVTLGTCPSPCSLLIPFIIIQVLSTAFGALCVTPIFVTVMRCVSNEDKTLALGLLAFTMSIVAFIPAPIVYGAVIDTACVLWKTTCGRSGNCDLYDVSTLRHRYIGLETASKAFACTLFALALALLTWEVRTGRSKDEKMDSDKSKKISDKCDSPSFNDNEMNFEKTFQEDETVKISNSHEIKSLTNEKTYYTVTKC